MKMNTEHRVSGIEPTFAKATAGRHRTNSASALGVRCSVFGVQFLILPLLLSQVSLAATEQTSSVLDGSGGRSSGGTLELVSAAGQPGGITVSSGGSLVNYAGFLNTFSLQPGLDTDGDGLANEVDADNDADGLEDLAEITGSAFGGNATTDPNQADSDTDGVSDGGEALSGSNPQDAAMYLHITQIIGGNDMSVKWQARHGMTYRVYRADDLTTGLPGTYLDEVTANDPAALPPWYETEAVYNHLGGGSGEHRAYYIEMRE